MAFQKRKLPSKYTKGKLQEDQISFQEICTYLLFNASGLLTKFQILIANRPGENCLYRSKIARAKCHQIATK